MDLYKELTEIESSISDTEFEKRLKFLMDETFSYLLQKAQRQKFDTDESHRQKQQSILEYADWMRLKARLRYEPDKNIVFQLLLEAFIGRTLAEELKLNKKNIDPFLSFDTKKERIVVSSYRLHDPPSTIIFGSTLIWISTFNTSTVPLLNK